MSLQTIFIRGFFSCEIDRPRGWQEDPDSEGWSYAHSLALVCPKCLDQWAVLAFSEEDCHPAGAYCERCRPAGREGGLPLIPGSIFSGWFIDLPLLGALPEPLLRREFELHLKEQEKWNSA